MSSQENNFFVTIRKVNHPHNGGDVFMFFAGYLFLNPLMAKMLSFFSALMFMPLQPFAGT